MIFKIVKNGAYFIVGKYLPSKNIKEVLSEWELKCIKSMLLLAVMNEV